MKMRIVIEVERDIGPVTDEDLRHAADITSGIVEAIDVNAGGPAYDSPAGSYGPGDESVAWSYRVEMVTP